MSQTRFPMGFFGGFSRVIVTLSSPKFTSGQLHATAKLARNEAQRKASADELDTLSRAFHGSLAASRDRFEKDRAAEKRFGRWIASVFLIPCFVLACGVTFILIHGLVAGDIIGGTRFSRTVYSLAEQPFQYWISVVVHAGLVASSWGLTAFAWRHSKWPNR